MIMRVAITKYTTDYNQIGEKMQCQVLHLIP
jgi:hypothetical protein